MGHEDFGNSEENIAELGKSLLSSQTVPVRV